MTTWRLLHRAKMMGTRSGLTIRSGFDCGKTTLVMSKPGCGQEKVQREKQRRAFLPKKLSQKDADANEYSNEMDPVDVNDHRLAGMPIMLTSFKWTWSPVLWMMTEVCINVYALHVMLVDEFNKEEQQAEERRRQREATRRRSSRGSAAAAASPEPAPRVQREPMEEKQFRCMLGLRMMSYTGTSGYWFEADEFHPTR
eukprot:SAG11_NODE_13548_length_650_cov_1.172414_1_plen_197_part_10